ncbi:MAG TPA: hypothetical protein VMF89_18100, partial [Polyangiales bacterium]|nr:hypothetical protein [Polyangiales bacterium]
GNTSDRAIARLVARQHDPFGRSCQLQHVAGEGPLRFLACGAAGLWIVRLAGDEASLVETRDLGGRVGPFFQANGRLWVEVTSVRAQEVTASGPEVSPLPAASAAPAPQPAAISGSAIPAQQFEPPIAGRVVERSDEQLVIALPGARVKPGTHIAFVSDVSKAGDEEQLYAVGRVVRSMVGRARVAIGTNEAVPENAQAYVTNANLSAGIFSPPRAGGVWELGFLARPFVVLDDLGVGIVLDGHAGYHFRAPFYVEASLSPLAVGSARAGAVGAVGAFASGSFDSHLFEVGLGLGAQTVNDPDFALDAGSGLLLAQRLRLGARDGAHLKFLSYVALFHSNFQFSSLRVEAQIPVGSRTWLRLAGGGGSVGLNFGEVGLRVLMSGNGGPGSFFLTTTIGWTNLLRHCNDVPLAPSGAAANSCEPIDYSGPMLGAGGEFRL